MDRNRLWTIGAVVAMLAVLAAGWFLGIQPQLNSASSANQNLATAQSQNVASQQLLIKLKKDYKGIVELKKKVATLRDSVPASANMSAFVTELDSLASAHQVEVKTITVTDAKAYTPPVSVAAAPAPGASATPAPTPSPSAAPVVSAPATPTAPVLVTDPRITAANFVAIPVTLAITGSYANVLDFVKGLQSGPRLFLVTALSTTAPTDTAPAGKASVGTTVGASVGGLVYVLLAQGSSGAGTK